MTAVLKIDWVVDVWLSPCCVIGLKSLDQALAQGVSTPRLGIKKTPCSAFFIKGGKICRPAPLYLVWVAPRLVLPEEAPVVALLVPLDAAARGGFCDALSALGELAPWAARLLRQLLNSSENLL